MGFYCEQETAAYYQWKKGNLSELTHVIYNRKYVIYNKKGFWLNLFRYLKKTLWYKIYHFSVRKKIMIL